jgi:rubrerythrin
MTPERKPAKTLAAIQSIEELMAHAHAIEAEAEARYRELAIQMELHNNREVAALFRTLERYEGQHAREIESRAAGMSLPVLDPWEFKWADAEGPELVDSLSMHYLMSPRMVLVRALQAERQAFAFFNKLASSTTDIAISDMAKNFAADEQEHISMIKNLLAKLKYPQSDWDDDLDPPVALE